jgi:TolA-binding protein
MNDTEKKALAELQAQIRNLGAGTAELSERVEKSREQTEQTAQEVYEFALDNFHGERGYRRIKDMADAAGVSFREAYAALANEFRPKAPEVGESGHGSNPTSTEMSAEEERRMLGYTHEDIEAHAKTRGIPYRAAMIELSTTAREAR